MAPARSPAGQLVTFSFRSVCKNKHLLWRPVAGQCAGWVLSSFSTARAHQRGTSGLQTHKHFGIPTHVPPLVHNHHKTTHFSFSAEGSICRTSQNWKN
mmetsp:Transcript_21802/g.35255  ORF Transcript_21802/g.35255 Transcript_21802/m.35255 type:complete len:98 (+) Transcript_21802:135-428(+)